MINAFHHYAPRPIRFLELWCPAGWQIKVYGIAYGRPSPRQELIDAAKSVAAQRLSAIAPSDPHYAVGFLGIHDGRTANFIFIDWWQDENELHHHVYLSPADDASRLAYKTPTGLAACVWDLRVIEFERKAWLDHVLKRPERPDFAAYLNERLDEDS